MKCYILNNGIRIQYHKMINTHSITVGLYVKGGCVYENEEIFGITHFLEHLHFRKIGDITQEELYYQMESLGSTLRATTYRDFLKFSMKVVPIYIDKCVEIFCKLIEQRSWSEVEFEKERQVVINQILENENYLDINKLARNVIFREHNLSNEIMGTVESIKHIKIEDVVKFKRELFNVNNFVICITGNLTDLQFEEIAKKLESISIEKGREREGNWLAYPKFFGRRKPEVKFFPVEYGNLLDVNLSFDVSIEKISREMLILLNGILGEGVGSKLQKFIREDYCYTSNIGSYVEQYREFAILHICFTVEKKVLLPCFEMIVRILKELKSSIIKRDLDVVLPFYTMNHAFYEDDTEEMNFQLAYHNFVLDTEFSEFKIENNSNTILRLEKCAEEIFTKDNLCIVIMGDAENVSKEAIYDIFNIL